MIETGVMVGLDGQALYWHLIPGRSAVYIPDSSLLWDVFWKQRQEIDGFAHSHPGEGCPVPSWEDLTSFSGIETGLGRRLKWWITSQDQMILLTWRGPRLYDYHQELIGQQPSWLAKLRKLSYY